VEDNPNFIEEYHLEPNECEEYDLDTKQKKSFWDLIKTLFCLNFFTAEKRGRTKERKMPQRVPTEVCNICFLVNAGIPHRQERVILAPRIRVH
jgi:hypothetical protein